MKKQTIAAALAAALVGSACLGTGMQTEAAQWGQDGTAGCEQAGGIRRTMDLTRQEHGAISMTPGIILMDQVIC